MAIYNYSILTYNAHSINDGTNYRATFLAGVPLLPDTDPILVERSENWPVFAGKALPGHEITMEINIRTGLATIGTRRDELKSWFPTDDQALRKLIVQDTGNSNKQWYIYCTPTSFVPDGRRVIITLAVPDPYWRAETATTVTWAVTSSGDQETVTPAGNANSKPVLVITPNNAKTGSYGYKRFVSIFNASTNKLVDYPVELTGGWNTGTEVGAGRMQADGDDLRVSVDGVEVDRWITGINTASTKAWVNLTLSEPVTLTLSGALGVGALSTISFKKTKANKRALQKLPNPFTILIGSEYLICSNPVPGKWSATVVSRAAYGTSAAAHSDGDACNWLEHAVWVYYGNSTATAPDVDDTRKPILDLTNSTNTSWVYTEFADDDLVRTGIWIPAMLSSTCPIPDSSTSNPPSDTYTATQKTYADPASVAGIAISAYQYAGAWKAETASGEWRLYQPCGVTTIASASGSKYRFSSTWATGAGLYKSASGGNWASAAAVTTPSTTNTWEAWNVGATALGATYNYLRLTLAGSVKGIASNYIGLEMTAITLTLDNTKTPSVTFGAQQNNYFLDCTITDTTTGDAITLQYVMGTGQSITIDCENKTVTHSNGSSARGAFDTNTRRLAWFDLPPGANVLQFDDTGTNDVTVTVTYRDRNN